MARKARKPNVKTAQKTKNKNLLHTIKKVLEFFGKPFYKILSFLTILLLFIFQLTGRSLIFFSEQIFVFISKITKKLKKKKRVSRQRKQKKLKLKIGQKVSKKVFTRIFVSSKLLFLKTKLLFVKLDRAREKKFKNFPTLYYLIFFLVIFGGWFFIFKDLPSPKELVTRDQEISTKIYSRDGVLLYQIYKNQNRTLVKLENVPSQVRLATLAAEDAEFYSHPGFSIKGISRAIIRNIKRDSVSGGSTITQQLVKNALLSSEKTIIRKIREIVLAVGVEMIFEKEEILEMYLNEVSYGGTTYGIQEAAQVYFDKGVEDLNLAESAFLSGLPKSPTTFSPFGPAPEKGVSRQKDVLSLMLINNFISEEEYFAAIESKLDFAENKTQIKAPHFVMYTRQKLEEEYGRELVEKGGLQVITTLDWQIQQIAEEAVEKEINRLTPLNVTNGAVIVLDARTGEVLAMVGSKDYFDTENDGSVNVTTRLRQPGSSIKPVNYAYALSTTFTPATIIDDSPITYNLAGSPPYSPKNYDGSFKGKISLRSALAQSRNVPAVKVLESYGVEKMFELGKLMGITTWLDISKTGLSLTLGGKEVKLIELAQVYSVFANRGQKNEIEYIKSIVTFKNKELFQKENKCIRKKAIVDEAGAAEAVGNICPEKQVLDPRVSFLITDILRDNTARSPAFGQNSLLNISGHPEVSVKTGTSNNLRDNLAIGYNQDYVVAVWVGNNDNSPMARVASGITGATPIWNKIMTTILSEKESVSWITPKGLVQIGICPVTGSLPCEGCPIKHEWFLEESIPSRHCKLEGVFSPTGQLLEKAAQTTRP